MSHFTDAARLGNTGAVVSSCLDAGRPALVGYLPVGYPSVAQSMEAFRAVVEGEDGRGADIVEIGIPYSDPLMDGLVIQHATVKARARGVHTRDAFTAAETVAATGAALACLLAADGLPLSRSAAVGDGFGSSRGGGGAGSAMALIASLAVRIVFRSSPLARIRPTATTIARVPLPAASRCLVVIRPE